MVPSQYGGSSQCFRADVAPPGEFTTVEFTTSFLTSTQFHDLFIAYTISPMKQPNPIDDLLIPKKDHHHLWLLITSTSMGTASPASTTTAAQWAITLSQIPLYQVKPSAGARAPDSYPVMDQLPHRVTTTATSASQQIPCAAHLNAMQC